MVLIFIIYMVRSASVHHAIATCCKRHGKERKKIVKSKRTISESKEKFVKLKRTIYVLSKETRVLTREFYFPASLPTTAVSTHFSLMAAFVSRLKLHIILVSNCTLCFDEFSLFDVFILSLENRVLTRQLLSSFSTSSRHVNISLMARLLCLIIIRQFTFEKA